MSVNDYRVRPRGENLTITDYRLPTFEPPFFFSTMTTFDNYHGYHVIYVLSRSMANGSITGIVNMIKQLP
jgi:hypothetical protein